MDISTLTNNNLLQLQGLGTGYFFISLSAQNQYIPYMGPN